MPNSTDLYKETFLHVIPVHVIVPWLIITATTTGTFFAPKAVNVKPPKASLDAIIELAGGICGGVLVKDFAVYKKSINK